ncbi:siderophore [Venturia inaequalis]|uniref:Siderophore n=1 Tax=Venturia inaequalis TaxID=5025 RepID=A0A8H3VH57_VENIN|nr:siderophore [Venturia inaequalis]RDI86759.1 hypothetical protein Vi05172_g3241 [Venturia inaequalis]
MAILPIAVVEDPDFETISRFVTCLLNENLVAWTPLPCPVPSGSRASGILLHRTVGSKGGGIWVGTTVAIESRHRLWYKADLVRPILLQGPDVDAESDEVTNPRMLVDALRQILSVETKDRAWNQIALQLQNSAENTATWYSWAKTQQVPTLQSPAIKWEQSTIRAHPLHPMQRAFAAQKPMAQLPPSEIPSLLTPQVSFLAVDRASTRITGPFRRLLEPLLANFVLPPLYENEIVLPCMSRQIPAIQQNFPSARVLLLDAFTAEAKANLRTVVVPPKLGFECDMKLALACTIGSTIRTITPHTTCLGPEISSVIHDLAPNDDTWVCRELAAITGSQSNCGEASHLSCMLRENLEPRALAHGQRLIIAGALAERMCGEMECYAAVVFGLGDVAAKLDWFSEFTSKMIPPVLALAVESGICLEAHGQNTLVRVDINTHRIMGVCFRDFGSIKCHMPTLRTRGHTLLSALPDCFLIEDQEEEAWDIVRHTLIHTQLQVLIRALYIPPVEGWRIVREQLDNFFATRPKSEMARRMRAFLFQPVVRHKAFVGMKLSPSRLEVRF